MPSCGYLINAHASLLPKYRGASPIAQAILDGESETGVSVMRIEREMDAGPVALTLRTPIAARENTSELSNRLAEIAATAIEETVEMIARGDIAWTEQDARLATVAPKLQKSDAVLDLRESARALACRIHALSPRPGGTLVVTTGSADTAKATDDAVLKVSRAEISPFETNSGSSAATARPTPGTIEQNVGEIVLRIATGDGWLMPLVMQRAGGKALPIADFLRGFELASDARCALPDLAGEAST